MVPSIPPLSPTLECRETKECALGYRCLPVEDKMRCLPRAETGRWLGSTLVAGAVGVFPGILATCATGLCSGVSGGIAATVGGMTGALVGSSLGSPIHLMMSRHRRPSQTYRRRVSNSWLIGFGAGFLVVTPVILENEPLNEAVLVGLAAGGGLGLITGIAGLIHHRLSKESPLKPIVKNKSQQNKYSQEKRSNTPKVTTPTAPLQ